MFDVSCLHQLALEITPSVPMIGRLQKQKHEQRGMHGRTSTHARAETLLEALALFLTADD